jgi:hypothetical protein
VHNRALRDREHEVGRMRNELETVSDLYPLPFLTGLFNSSAWAAIIAGRTTEAVVGGTQPNDYADQVIPVPDPALIVAVGQAAWAARAEGYALATLIAAGWQRLPQGWRSPPVVPSDVQLAPFGIARIRWGLTIERPTVRCGTLRREGENFISGRRVAARLSAHTEEAAADFLLRVLNAEGAHTIQALEAMGLPIPLRPQDAAVTERTLVAAERAALAREQIVLDRRAEIDALVGPLFESVQHPPIEACP